jgi:hypothetical protein
MYHLINLNLLYLLLIKSVLSSRSSCSLTHMRNNKFDMMRLVILTLSIITLIGTLAVAFPLIFAQTNEGEGQMPEFNETEDETFSLITLNGEQIKEIRSNLNRTSQAIENGNTTKALANLTIIDEQFSAVSAEASAFGDFR